MEKPTLSEGSIERRAFHLFKRNEITQRTSEETLLQLPIHIRRIIQFCTSILCACAIRVSLRIRIFISTHSLIDLYMYTRVSNDVTSAATSSPSLPVRSVDICEWGTTWRFEVLSRKRSGAFQQKLEVITSFLCPPEPSEDDFLFLLPHVCVVGEVQEYAVLPEFAVYKHSRCDVRTPKQIRVYCYEFQ